MTTKTKAAPAKNGLKLSPGLDLAETDPRMSEHLLAGKEFIVLRHFKRAGVEYQRGDKIVLGEFPRDGFFLRRHHITGGTYVALPERFAFSEYDRDRKEYDREVLVELRNRVSWFTTDLARCEGRITELKNQMRHLQTERKNFQGALKKATSDLAAAEDAAPQLEEF